MELLVAAHIAVGELGILAFVWVLLEVLNGPSESGVWRAKAAAILGTGLFFAAWIVGGTYYVVQYGSVVKSVITQGAWPWAHGIFMEVKEHVFLFLPFLSLTALVYLWRSVDSLEGDHRVRGAFYALIGSVILLGALMTVMGYFVTSGYRQGLLGL
jgi:hypothetical protein